jgi:hypothetical protein
MAYCPSLSRPSVSPSSLTRCSAVMLRHEKLILTTAGRYRWLCLLRDPVISRSGSPLGYCPTSRPRDIFSFILRAVYGSVITLARTAQDLHRTQPPEIEQDNMVLLDALGSDSLHHHLLCSRRNPKHSQMLSNSRYLGNKHRGRLHV